MWSGQRFHTNKAKEANGWIPALQHHHVELTLGWIIYCDELNNTTCLGHMCHVELMCKHTETGWHFTSQEVDGIRWWFPSWLMLPDMTHMILDSIHYGTYESLAASPPQEYKDSWYGWSSDQDAKIYTPLMHKPLGFGTNCAMLLLD